jgi:STAS domain
VAVAAEPITDVDTTAADVLERLDDELAARGVRLVFAGLKGPVKDRLHRYGLGTRFGQDRFYPTIGTVVSDYVARTGTTWTDWTDERAAPQRGVGRGVVARGAAPRRAPERRR